MIRSAFAITRIFIFPFAVLLVFYLLAVAGGGTWLYFKVREAESRILVDELVMALEPLAQKLSVVDAVPLVGDTGSWVNAELKTLFARLPALREVSVRSHEQGFMMAIAKTGDITTEPTAPLAPDAVRADATVPAVERLHSKSDGLFLVRFDLSPAGAPPVRLDFGFSRSELLAPMRMALDSLEQATMLLGMVGVIGILIALGITVFAARAARRMESHFQEVYRRASAAELISALVHDLRNPLMALRANVKALLVSPGQTREIVAELDRDIVALNDKLSSFLDLARSHDAAFAPTDVKALIADAARLAEPAVSKQGLTLELDIESDLPRPAIQALALRDALLNLIINAAQSGQTEGAIRVSARAAAGEVTISVEDRGQGIAPSDLPHIFDAFYTTKTYGNGLGLAIVQRIVENHNGRVVAENREGGGARVSITLPVQQPEIPRWWKATKTPCPI